MKASPALALLVAVAACARGTVALKGETRDSIASTLVVGSTTEAEIRGRYGEPARQSSANGRTTWTYGLASDAPHVTNFIPIVNFLDSGGSQSTRLLMVEFGPDQRLRDYIFRSTSTDNSSGLSGAR